MSTIGVYIDTCIYIVATIFVADVFVRLFRVVREYFFYANYYLPDHRLYKILARAFKYNLAAVVLLMVTVVMACTRLQLLPPVSFLKYMPLYWIYCVVNFKYSPLDYAYWMRADHGLDSAAGMASSFFHGYIKLIMPSNDSGIRKRIALYENEEKVTFITNRLVILVPTEMYIDSEIESNILEKAKPLCMVRKNRAGIYRPYQNDVYRITKPVNGKYYYVALEGATPILTFFESMNFQLTTTWQMQEMKREILLKFYKYLRRLIKWHETEQHIELMLYNTYKDNGERLDIGEMLLAHFLKHHE